MPQETPQQPRLTPEQVIHQEARTENEARWQSEADAITAQNLGTLSGPARLLERTTAKIPGVGSDLIETADEVMQQEAHNADAAYNEKYKLGELMLEGTMTREDWRKRKLSLSMPEPDRHTPVELSIPVVGRTLEQARLDALNKARSHSFEELSETTRQTASPVMIKTTGGAEIPFDAFVAPALEKERLQEAASGKSS